MCPQHYGINRKGFVLLEICSWTPKVGTAMQKLSYKPISTLCLILSTLLPSLLLHDDHNIHVPDRRTREMTKESKEPPVCPF